MLKKFAKYFVVDLRRHVDNVSIDRLKSTSLSFQNLNWSHPVAENESELLEPISEAVDVDNCAGVVDSIEAGSADDFSQKDCHCHWEHMLTPLRIYPLGADPLEGPIGSRITALIGSSPLSDVECKWRKSSSAALVVSFFGPGASGAPWLRACWSALPSGFAPPCAFVT